MTRSALCCPSPFFMQQPWFILCYLDRKWLPATQLTAWSSGSNSMGYSLAINSLLLMQRYIFVPCFGYNLNEEGPFHHLIIILIIICPSTVSLAREWPCWLSEVILLFSLEQPSFLEGLFLQKTWHSLWFSLHSWPSNCKQVFFLATDSTLEFQDMLVNFDL